MVCRAKKVQNKQKNQKTVSEEKEEEEMIGSEEFKSLDFGSKKETLFRMYRNISWKAIESGT